MPEDTIFKENVKNSFIKVKEHMNELEQALKAQKAEIQEIKDLLNKLLESKKQNSEELSPNEPEIEEIPKSSTGNEGVHSFIHSFNNHSFIHYAHSLDKLGKDLKKTFLSLARQEFLVFLTIYQLEDEIKQVTYNHLADNLKISEGCIRMYVSNLIKKGLPLTKRKINNRYNTLHIEDEFRKLNLKQTLTNLFYDTDPGQKKLFDNM